jgi:exonuclease VII small subunit
MSDKKSENENKKPNLTFVDVNNSSPKDISALLDQAFTKAKNELNSQILKSTGALHETIKRVGLLEEGYTKLESGYQNLDAVVKADKTGLNDYKQKCDAQISELETKLNNAYPLVKIDAKNAKFFYGDAEVNLFENPKQVYDEMHIEIPGTFSNVSKIELVYLNKDGQLYKKTRQVLETTTNNGKTMLNIGQYKLPSNAVKIGLGLYGQNLDDNTKGD